MAAYVFSQCLSLDGLRKLPWFDLWILHSFYWCLQHFRELISWAPLAVQLLHHDLCLTAQLVECFHSDGSWLDPNSCWCLFAYEVIVVVVVVVCICSRTCGTLIGFQCFQGRLCRKRCSFWKRCDLKTDFTDQLWPYARPYATEIARCGDQPVINEKNIRPYVNIIPNPRSCRSNCALRCPTLEP